MSSVNAIARDVSLKTRLDVAFCVFVAIACVVLYCLPGYYPPLPSDTSQELVKAKVLAVDNDDIMTLGVFRQGEQGVTARILAGRHADADITAFNHINANPQTDYVYQPGDKVLLEVTERPDHSLFAVTRGPYRLDTQLWLCALFAGLLILVAGWTGVKALLSFIFAALILIKALFPLFLARYNPIWTSLAIAATLTASINFLVGGLNKKGLVAFLGGFLGLITTCLLSLAFAPAFHANGMARPFAKNLLQVVSTDLDLRSIFLAGVMIAASGAMMDLAMDISAAMDELSRQNPAMSARELWRSGLRVGRSVIGTMTTTLLLAYSGGYATLAMFFMAQGVPMAITLNTNVVSSEILNILVGSFGLVTVAPFTAATGALIFAARDK